MLVLCVVYFLTNLVLNIKMFKTKFVNFASFICLFGQTHNSNRETLCAFVSYLNLLHQLVMLGPKQPYHKNYSPEMDGRQSAKEHGPNY